MILEKIEKYLDDVSAAKLREYFDFLWLKLAKIDEKIRKGMRKETEEERCTAIQNVRETLRIKQYTQLLAFRDEFQLSEKVAYYWNYLPAHHRVHFLSQDHFRGYGNSFGLEASFKKYIEDKEYYMAYSLYEIIHEVEPIQTEGIQILFDNKKTKEFDFAYHLKEYTYYLINIFRGAHYLMKFGFYDRAMKRIRLLQKYQQDSRKMGRTDRQFAPKIAAITDFEEHIITAFTATDGEVARRWAALSIFDAVRALVENFRDEVTGDNYLCGDLNLAICVAIAFDFDQDWARECSRALMYYLDMTVLHQAFFKAVALGGWMRTPEEMNALPVSRVQELGRINWEKK